MTNVILYGFLSVLPLTLGAFLGSSFKIKEKFIGMIAALGAGAMIAALTFGLMEESLRLGGLDNAIIGFTIGGLLFIIGDYFIIKAGGRGHKRIYAAKNSTGWGIVLAAILDGIPEAIALGASLVLNPKLGLIVLIGIILNNFPESTSSAYDLKEAGKSNKNILLVWLLISLLVFIFVILGFTIFSDISPDATSTIQAIAAGSVLAMIATTMMPEAYQESGLDATFATILGFLLIFVLSKIT